MGRKSRRSTQALIGSAPSSTHGSEWSESTLCGDEARNSHRSGIEEPPISQTLDLQGNLLVEYSQVYGDVQGPQAPPCSGQCRRCSSAPSSSRPLTWFLNNYDKREFFRVGGGTIENMDLEELDESDLLPKLDDKTDDRISRSKPAENSSDGFRGELNSDEAKEHNEVSHAHELSRKKRRNRDGDVTREMEKRKKS